MFPKMGVPQNGRLVMENPIKMDDLGVPPFLETPIYIYIYTRSEIIDFLPCKNETYLFVGPPGFIRGPAKLDAYIFGGTCKHVTYIFGGILRQYQGWSNYFHTGSNSSEYLKPVTFIHVA